MPHNQSPLSLLDLRFHAFECLATDSETTDGGLSLTTEQFIKCLDEDTSLWSVALEVKFAPADPEKPSTYQGTIRASGEFQIHETFSEQNHEALIRVTATSILYGACREMLANFTARSTHGILSLPSISFRKSKKTAKKAAKKKSAE